MPPATETEQYYSAALLDAGQYSANLLNYSSNSLIFLLQQHIVKKNCGKYDHCKLTVLNGFIKTPRAIRCKLRSSRLEL